MRKICQCMYRQSKNPAPGKMADADKRESCGILNYFEKIHYVDNCFESDFSPSRGIIGKRGEEMRMGGGKQSETK